MVRPVISFDDPHKKSKPIETNPKSNLDTYRENRNEFYEFFSKPDKIWRSLSNRTVLGIPEKIKQYKDYDSERDAQYNPYEDPLLKDYFSLIPTHFFDSRSKGETISRIKLLNQKIEDQKNPYFNSISLVSEIFLDPSSVLILSKPLRFAMLGDKSNRYSKIGGVLAGEEAIKQVVDRDRTTADAIVTASIAGILHKLSPVLSKYDVRRNKFFYNKGDDFKGTTIDLDDLADATKTEVGVSGLLQGPKPIARKPGIPKNITDYVKVMKNEYPNLNIVIGKGVGKTKPKSNLTKVEQELKDLKIKHEKEKVAELGSNWKSRKDLNYNDGIFARHSKELDEVVQRVKAARNGKYVPAYFNKQTDTIILDIDGIKDMYKSGRPFKNVKMADGVVKGFKKKDFKDVDEFINFVMRHEFAHKVFKQLPKEPRASYENRINRVAYQQILDNRNDVIHRGSTMLDDSRILEQERINYARYNEELTKQLSWDDFRYKKTGLGIEKLGFLSPLDFIINKGSKTSKEFVINMLTSPLYYEFNKKFYSTPLSAETLRNTEHLPKLAEAIEEGYRVVAKINQDITGKKPKTKFGMKFAKGITPDEFFKEVFYARLNGNKHDIADIGQYAEYIGKNYYDVFAREINNLSLFMMEPIKRQDFAQGLVDSMINSKIKTKFIKETGETWTLAEAQKALKNANLDVELAEFTKIPNYVNINYRHDQIAIRFNEFNPLMRKLLADVKVKGKPKFDAEQIDDIVNSFKNYAPNSFPKAEKGKSPAQLYKMKAGYHSKHLKERFLKGIDYKELARKGFIEDNMEMNMSYYFRSVGPDIAVAKKYGDPYGFGWFYDGKNGYAPGLDQVYKSYITEIESLNKRIIGSNLPKKELDKLKKKVETKKDKLEEVITVLEATRELVKNKYGVPGDPNSYMFKTVTMMKVFNNLTMLTGFSQVADIGRVITVNGLMNTSKQLLQAFASESGKKIFKAGLKEGRLAGQMWDMTIAWSRGNIISGNDFLHTSFTGAEKIFQEANQFMFQYGNMQNPWNVVVKTAATIAGQTKILDIVERLATGKKVLDWERQYLASLGLGSQLKSEIKSIKDIYEAYKKYGHGPGTKNGLLEADKDLLKFANSDLWIKNGDELDAALKFRAALYQDVDNTIVTPSLGDAPLLANTLAGSLIFQYKKFGMSYTRRVVLRGLQAQDGRFLQSLASLTLLGMMIDAVRSGQTNAPYDNKTLAEKVLDGAERGGIGGIFTDIDRIVMALSDNKIGVRPSLLGLKRPYGTSLKRKMGSVTPTGSSIGNIMEIIYDWGRGRHTHHTARRIRRAIPYNNVWYADFLFDKLEKGLY